MDWDNRKMKNHPPSPEEILKNVSALHFSKHLDLERNEGSRRITEQRLRLKTTLVHNSHQAKT